MTGAPDSSNSLSPLQVVAGRLDDAGIGHDRFIDVEDGLKQSYDHTRRKPGSITGNYGVYCGDGLVGIDIDSIRDITPPLEKLPETFTVSTPHGGEHRYYHSKAIVYAKVLAATGGSGSPALSWGELYTSKYLVGPGSQITRCGSGFLILRPNPHQRAAGPPQMGGHMLPLMIGTNPTSMETDRK